MPSFIGIDLGTTFSALAVLDEIGRPVIVHNADGKNLTPSAVTEEEGLILVGEVARKAAAVDAASAAVRFKREMGTATQHRVNGHAFTPTELSVFVLKKLLQDAQASLGEIAEAVVTIPANFSNEAREATMAAAHAAGLATRYIINEPTAAALYYAYKADTPLEGIYAVYDLGGGTFDVSIIEVHGSDVEVRVSNGVSRLGGDDFDEALRALIAQQYQTVTGKPLPSHVFSRHDAEGVKIELSQRRKVRLAPAGHSLEVSRASFEEVISAKVSQAEMLCEATLEEAGLTATDITGVLLAGGSTRVPLVRESITRVFGKEPSATVNVDEVVALGAALYAAYRGEREALNDTQKGAVAMLNVAETSNKCFGTLSLGFDDERNTHRRQNSVLINKGERLPCSITQSFYTVADGQTNVLCTLTESTAPETDPRFVKIVWEAGLSLPPGRSAGQEIQVTFAYDMNQIMTCEFLDVATGRRSAPDPISMTAHDAMETEAIERFLVE